MSPMRGYVKQTIYQKIPVQIYKHTDTKDRYPPPGQCARQESELSIFRYTWVKLTINPPPHPKYHSEPKAVHGIQLYILQNGQLIGIYKEIPVQINRQLSPSPIRNCQSTESTLHCPMSPMRTHLKWSTNRNISGNKSADKLTIIPPPPISNCQSTESTLCCPMSPMRTHLKQSTNRNISGNTSADKLMIIPPSYDPPSPIWNCQSTESTLHCPMSPMRTHLKQSTNKNISGKEISPLPPFHHNFTDLIFRCSGLPAHTANCPPNIWVYQYQYIVFAK